MAGRWGGIGGRTFRIGRCEHVAVAFSEGIGAVSIELAAGIDDGLITFDQQRLHGLRPRLSVLLKSPFQLAQVVGIAEGMEAIVAEVGFPVVVADHVATGVGHRY